VAIGSTAAESRVRGTAAGCWASESPPGSSRPHRQSSHQARSKVQGNLDC
jgi:hypothetical protein